MQKQPQHRIAKKGFTLVEMSIVIVIIGLLVGGIMSLLSYLSNAQIKTMMNDSQMYVSAFSDFQKQYNSPPGDYAGASLAWTGAGNGDANGLIRANGGSPGNTAEYYYVFQHLTKAGFIEGAYTGAVNGNGGATAGVNIPTTAVDKTGYIFDHPDALDGFVSGDALYPDGQYGNVLRIAGVSTNSSTIPTTPFLSPRQMKKLDDKYDDGAPYTGNMVAPKTTTLANCTVLATSIYNTAGTDDKYCYVILKMQ